MQTQYCYNISHPIFAYQRIYKFDIERTLKEFIIPLKYTVK